MSTAALPPERRSEIARKAALAVRNRYKRPRICGHARNRPRTCPACARRVAQARSRRKAREGAHNV